MKLLLFSFVALASLVLQSPVNNAVIHAGCILAIRFYRQVETNLVDPLSVTVSIGGESLDRWSFESVTCIFSLFNLVT